MRAMARIGAPIEWLLSTPPALLLRLLPLRGDPPPVTDQEIGFMLREGVAAGHIPQAETAIVEMALRLGDRRGHAGMKPRAPKPIPHPPHPPGGRPARPLHHGPFPLSPLAGGAPPPLVHLPG